MPLWTPANLATPPAVHVDGSCALWSASADGAGTAVTADGAAVARVTGLAGTATLRQATGGNRPTLVTSENLNGYRLLRVGSAGSQVLASDAVTLASEFLMVYVLRIRGSTPGGSTGIFNYFRLGGFRAAGGPYGIVGLGAPASPLEYSVQLNQGGSGGYAEDVADGGAQAGDFTFPWRLLTVSRGGGNVTLRRDGGQAAVTIAATFSGFTGAVGICGAADLVNPQTQPHDLAAAVVASGNPSATDALTGQSVRDSVEGYLAWRFGLQALLPGAHPFAARAPAFGSARPALALRRARRGGAAGRR